MNENFAIDKSKPTLYILYSNFLDDTGDKLVIGGIQQYILGLINVFKETHNIKIIQKAKKNFIKKQNQYEVYGFEISNKNLGKQLLKKIESQLNANDYIIWGTDRISAKTKHENTISIQHGITFDFIDYKSIKFGELLKKSNFISVLYRVLQQINAVRFFLKTSKVVCVDYNYLNWIRTILPRTLTNRAVVIPNFSKIPKEIQELKKDNIKILFARRFVAYRGIYILSEIIEYISKKHPNVVFGIYGEGPLEGYLKDKFRKYKNVTISSYTADQAQDIQLNYDISLIPTFGSEGTSLSLLESMACGCAPIASNIGGMTNIVLDGFNGYLVNPEPKEFIDKIESLINNPESLKEMKRNAINTIQSGFSFDIWKNKWKKLINNN